MHISNEFDDTCRERIKVVSDLKPGSRVHLCGVCGTGMSAVLSLLKQLGFYCTGSDKAFYPPMGDVVRNLADRVFDSYSASNIPDDLDLVVIGNALSRGNPEVEAVLERNIPYASMPEVFSALLIGNRDHCPNSIVVTGTHGKTTTSSMMAGLLEDAGLAPAYFIGGMPGNLPSNVRPVNLETPHDKRSVVLEGDEYDSAFFAKFSKFHCYRPDYIILTSIEFDHADIFESIEDIDLEFTTLAKRVPSSGTIFYCHHDKHVAELVDRWKQSGEVQAKLVSYGFEEGVDAIIHDRKIKAQHQRIIASFQGEAIEFELPISGQYNALNAFACFLVARSLGVSAKDAARGLSRYSGVARRQQVLFESENLILIEDFAHHPTAVRKTLQGLREAYPERRIIAVFEPRSNTSRRNFFQEAYSEAFVDADVAMILKVADAGSYSKHDQEIEALDVDSVVAKVQALGTEASSSESVDELTVDILASIQNGDLIVLMSNGDFGGLPATLKEAVSEKF